MERNEVVLVDEQDNPLGVIEKLAAHEKGLLHRAFSIFLFNENGELLLQQRAENKYHGAGLWTNACCSHPQWNEDIKVAAIERLAYEMGMTCELDYVFSFIYHTAVENDLIEHEYDHVFVGYTNTNPTPNPAEVQNYKWVNPESLLLDIHENPANYTFWFRSAINEVLSAIQK